MPQSSEPKPPAGYTLAPLSDIPAFIRENVDPSKVQQVVMPPRTDDVKGTETISQAFPGRIEVYHPEKYTKGTQTHEMTHEDQDARSEGTIKLPRGYELAPFGRHSSQAPEKYQTGTEKNYDYGGEQGLLDAQKQHKGIGEFNKEQQADMVEDYQKKYNDYMAKAKAGTITQMDKRDMYQTYKAYHPYIQQMANVPKTFKDTLPSISAMFGAKTPLAPAPAAPGLPDYSVAGMGVIPADSLMGGKSVPIPTPKR